MLASIALSSLLASSAFMHGGAFPAPPRTPAPAPPSLGPRAGGPATSGPTSPGAPVGAPGVGPGVSGSGGPSSGTNELDWMNWWNFERDDSMVSAALIAVARIGSGDRHDLALRIEVAVEEKLRAKSQEVAETAALSLGILGEDAALEPLLSLLASNEEGRRLANEKVVPTRTRAFAAFGLGLMAHQREDPVLRQRIAAALMEAMTGSRRSSELPTAAALALGLCPVPNRLTVPDKITRTSAFAHDVVARGAQIRWLIGQVGTDSHSKSPLSRLARIQGATALGRLGGDASPQDRERAIRALIELGTSRESPIHLRASAWIGLGEALKSGGDAADRAGLKSLLDAMKKGHILEQHFASMAVARATSRPGAPLSAEAAPHDGAVVDQRWAGIDVGRRALLRQLARGRSDSLPWFSLAMGVQNWHLQRAGMPNDPIVALALRDRVRTERSAAFIGGHAIACALAHEGSDDEDQPTSARAFAIVGLGLLCEDSPLPWRTPAAHANPYFAVTETLSGNGRGLLELN